VSLATRWPAWSRGGRGSDEFRVGDRVLPPLRSLRCLLLLQTRQQNLCQDLLFNTGLRRVHADSGAHRGEEPAACTGRMCLCNTPRWQSAWPASSSAWEASGARAGDTMVVIEQGPIGLMFLHAAQLSGIRVIAVVKREDQIAGLRATSGAPRSRGADQPHTGVDTLAAVRALTDDSRGGGRRHRGRWPGPPPGSRAAEWWRKGGVVNFLRAAHPAGRRRPGTPTGCTTATSRWKATFHLTSRHRAHALRGSSPAGSSSPRVHHAHGPAE